jgi:hypothetical protein
MAASEVPERTASVIKLSPTATLVGIQPTGTAPHSSGNGEEVVGIGVGNAVVVGVTLTRGMTCNGVWLGAMMVTSAMRSGGAVGTDGGAWSSCASSNASSTVPTTPSVMITFQSHRSDSCVSSSITYSRPYRSIGRRGRIPVHYYLIGAG